MTSNRYAHEPAYRRKLKYHAIMSKGDTHSACGRRVCYDTFVIYDNWCKIDRKRLCRNCLRAVTDPLAIDYERNKARAKWLPSECAESLEKARLRMVQAATLLDLFGRTDKGEELRNAASMVKEWTAEIEAAQAGEDSNG